jgi:hypothetical protein
MKDHKQTQAKNQGPCTPKSHSSTPPGIVQWASIFSEYSESLAFETLKNKEMH